MREGKRSYVRIPIAINVSFNIIGNEEKTKVVEALNKGEGDFYENVSSFSRLIMEKYKLHETKEVNPVVLELLVYLMKRVDEISSRLEHESKRFYEHQAVTLDLGGGGFSFGWDRRMEKETMLDVFLHIPLFPKTGIRAVGRVVSCDEGNNGFIVRVSFDYIREDDREDIIKFVFIKQRELLARRCLGRT